MAILFPDMTRRAAGRVGAVASALVVIAAALAVTACGGGGSNAQTCGGVQGAVLVKMSEYKFDPSTVKVKSGKSTICLANTGSMTHDMAVMQSGSVVAKSDEVGAGDSSRFAVDLKPGTYQIECTLPGHAQAGMKGTLEAT